MKQVAAEGANIQCPGCRRLGLLGVKCGGRRDLHSFPVLHHARTGRQTSGGHRKPRSQSSPKK